MPWLSEFCTSTAPRAGSALSSVAICEALVAALLESALDEPRLESRESVDEVVDTEGVESEPKPKAANNALLELAPVPDKPKALISD
jgi:hypothetical protein